MPRKCKVGYSNHHMNTCFPKAIQTDKSLPRKSLSGKDFLGREIPARARFPGQRKLWLGKFSWAGNLWPGKVPGQSNLCTGKVTGKGFLGRDISAKD